MHHEHITKNPNHSGTVVKDNQDFFFLIYLSSKCYLSSSAKPKGKKGGGKEKPKTVKSSTGGEQFPEVCTVQGNFYLPLSI